MFFCFFTGLSKHLHICHSFDPIEVGYEMREFTSLCPAGFTISSIVAFGSDQRHDNTLQVYSKAPSTACDTSFSSAGKTA